MCCSVVQGLYLNEVDAWPNLEQRQTSIHLHGYEVGGAVGPATHVRTLTDVYCAARHACYGHARANHGGGHGCCCVDLLPVHCVGPSHVPTFPREAVCGVIFAGCSLELTCYATRAVSRAVYFRRLPWLLLFTLAELMGTLSDSAWFELIGCDLLGLVLLFLAADVTASTQLRKLTVASKRASLRNRVADTHGRLVLDESFVHETESQENAVLDGWIV